jgi:hypothetical protein
LQRATSNNDGTATGGGKNITLDSLEEEGVIILNQSEPENQTNNQEVMK